MNILIVTMQFPPSVGGGETIVYDHARSLAKLGHTVSVITEALKGNQQEIPEAGFTLIRSQTMNDISAGKLDLSEGLSGIAKIIQRIDPEIIHVHNYQAAIAVFLITANLRAKIVFSQYATPIPKSKKIIGYLGDYKYEEALAQFCYKSNRYSMAVEISDVYANWALQCGAPKEKLKKIYPGIDINEWKERPVDSALKADLGFKDEDTIVFAPIRFVKRKGILDFIKAAHYIQQPNIRLLICGTYAKTDPVIGQELHEMLKDKHINSKVVIHDSVPLDELPSYFSIADLVCLPSHIEGLGMVLLEAMAMKRPVLATAVPGITEIVNGNQTGFLVPPHDPKSMAHAIELILSNPSESSQRVQAAYEMVAKKFNLGIQTKELVSTYRALLDKL